jgi:hypothetical protein
MFQSLASHKVYLHNNRPAIQWGDTRDYSGNANDIAPIMRCAAETEEKATPLPGIMTGHQVDTKIIYLSAATCSMTLSPGPG